MNRRQLLAASGVFAISVGMGGIARSDIPSAAFPFKKTVKKINGSAMAYVDTGAGRPVVFLHGNPTSSYLWRNIIPFVTDDHRAIAPDLIGMGDSAKPDLGYTYADHAAHLHGLLDALDLNDAILVVHDWGSALGLDWARANPDRVAGVAFMEAIMPPAMPVESYEAMGELGDLFRNLRTPGVGEKMVLEDNFFVEVILRDMGVATPIAEARMAAYRAPFPTPKSRAPLLQWPREIPIGGEPAPVVKVVNAYSAWFLETEIPKLMITAEPGAIMPPPAAAWLKENLKNLTSVHVGAGTHFIQEDHPDAIGQALADWLKTV